MVSLLIFVGLAGSIILGVYCGVHHLQDGDIESTLLAAYQVTGTIPLIVSFSTIMYHKEKVRKVMDTFQQISDECKYHQLD